MVCRKLKALLELLCCDGPCSCDELVTQAMHCRSTRIEKLLERLVAQGERIMSAIGDFAVKQKGFNDRMDAALAGLASDVAILNATIAELQNTSGAITPEDQALLDQLESWGDAFAAKLEALDSLTPPVPPIG
jgi:ABC-type transporter Mla subunit MlaD